MTERTYGAIVSRRGLPSSLDYAVGQDVETYVLLDPFDHSPDPPLDEPGIPWDWHAWTKAQAPRLASERKAGQGREIRRHSCTCPKAPSIATEYVDTQGTTWVIVGPERVPAAFRRSEDFDPAWHAIPLHSHPNGTAHVEITTCRRCNQGWAVGISSNRVQTARVRATRGVKVAP